MASPISRVTARSQLSVLLATAFAHPSPDDFSTMCRGEWQQQVEDLTELLLGEAKSLPTVNCSYAEFEAFYIDLFHTGRKGQPMLSLCASGYSEILQGGGLPEFLLRFSRWYRHFGLDTRDGEIGCQAPDHIQCQLEFLGWLAHLELQALVELSDPADVSSPQILAYQKAQRDFLQRELLPTVEAIDKAMRDVRYAKTDAGQFYSEVMALTQCVLERSFQELDSSLGPDLIAVSENTVINNVSESNSMVNIWE